MSLTIEIAINGRQIAVARAQNLTATGDISDYRVSALSDPSSVTGAHEMWHNFTINRHDRVQSAWSLVAKIAEQIAENEARR